MATTDENQIAIRELIDIFVEGWNSSSGDKLASVFAEAADFTAITGLHGRGREIIAQAHNEILATIYRDTTLTAEIELIDFFAPDVALVNAKFFLRRDGQSFFPGVSHTSCGIIAVRREGAWQLAAFRNMVPFARPMPGPIEKELSRASA